MRIRKPGKIYDGLWFLGREESCVYLLEGKNGSILINGGLSYIVPELLEQFRSFRIDESKINKFLVLHSHFDHVGIIPFFKRRYPNMVIYASARSLEVFKKAKAIPAINASNRYAIENKGFAEVCANYDLDWWVGIEGKGVSDGDHIELGDMEVRITETPGHSPCSISAYVPELNALFPSDAGGIPSGDIIVASGTSNFTEYENSLNKLKSLEVRYLCSDHNGYATGNEAATFIDYSIQMAKWQRYLMLNTYRHFGNLEEAAKMLASIFRVENFGDFLPDEIHLAIFRQMIRHVTELGK